MFTKEVSNGIHYKSWCENIEDGAIKQIENLSRLPFAFHHIAIMPDCHQGWGMPIGGVLACKDVVVPNAVGVDVGCSVTAVKTNLNILALNKETRKNIMGEVRKNIPFGEGKYPLANKKLVEYLNKLDLEI
jgi:tRNA-splicing ligase RtcB